MEQPRVRETKLSGLLLVDLVLHEDSRGSFREGWQGEKMQTAGLPELTPVQFNVSANRYGVLRGIHAEPWDKYIHAVYGEAYAAIVDLRKDSVTFGKYESFNLDETNALYVPSGLGNSFQSLTEGLRYTYLVTSIWDGSTKYPAVAFDDPELAIPWPITGEKQIVSEKDRSNLTLKEAYPR